MKNQPLVSIIIPTFNRAYLIGETLDSVLAQTYQNWECIIVDDGSSDNTDKVVGEYVKKDNRFKYYHRPEEHLPGGNGARNYGFKMSQGEYVNWFDDDDLMLPEKIEFKVNKILESNYDFVVCEGSEVDENLNILKKWNKIDSDNPIIDHIYGKLVFSTNGPLFRKSLLSKSDGFNERLKKKQEWEYFTRLLLLGNNYYAIHKALFYVRVNKNKANISRFIKSKNLANNLVYKLIEKNRPDLFNHSFKRHFLHKFISNLRLSCKSKNHKYCFHSFFFAFRIINFKYILNYFKLKNANR